MTFQTASLKDMTFQTAIFNPLTATMLFENDQ